MLAKSEYIGGKDEEESLLWKAGSSKRNYISVLMSGYDAHLHSTALRAIFSAASK